jgi:uncharacterized membrane-anchored protein
MMIGMVTLGGILAKIASNRAQLTDNVSKSMYRFEQTRKYVRINLETELYTLSKFFEKNSAGFF